jgi:hypothetical protein
MVPKLLRLLVISAGAGLLAHDLRAQVIGSYDNFDVFNDTGVVAEGFEIDVEDVKSTDLTRRFPSNFAEPWLIRYGLPKVTSYDWTAKAPDADHSFDAGHKGVLITWAAVLRNGKWVASQGHNPAAPGVAGDGTPYNPHPTPTAGESCWWWGLGAPYPSAGCDHYGISFAAGIVPGKITYHWKIPNAANTKLVNGPLEASIPPSPVLTPVKVPIGKPPVVQAIARAPNDAAQNPERPQAMEAQYGDAYWVKTTTFYSPKGAVLDNLQQVILKKSVAAKAVSWTLMQRPPGVGPNAGRPERAEVEREGLGAKNVQVTKQYQYYKFGGVYDSETHEALCEAFYATQAAALAGGKTVQVSCQNTDGADRPYTKTYWVIDPGPGTALKAMNGNLGAYIGAHVNAYNVK